MDVYACKVGGEYRVRDDDEKTGDDDDDDDILCR